jgi:hypothetical protein
VVAQVDPEQTHGLSNHPKAALAAIHRLRALLEPAGWSVVERALAEASIERPLVLTIRASPWLVRPQAARSALTLTLTLVVALLTIRGPRDLWFAGQIVMMTLFVLVFVPRPFRMSRALHARRRRATTSASG